jgi:phosphatidylglycerophosphate synthase
LPVVVRTILVLERMGVERAYLLVEREHRAMVASALAGHPRLRIPFEIVASEGDSLASLVRVLAERSPDAEVLVWPATLSLGRRAPEWRAAPPRGMLIGHDAASGRDSGLMLTTVAVLRAHPDLSVPALAERLAKEGSLERVSLPEGAIVVVDRAAARLAERELLRSLRKSADGVVAKFDRYVSLAISRHLMALPIKPNNVTVVAALVGLSCGLLVAHGGYAWMLLGAVAFQLNSILDGVDGEIARAKLLESRSGQWLDTLSDDLSNLAFILGVSVGSYRTWGQPTYLALGAVAGVSFLISSAIMYHYLITRTQTGDLNDFVMPWNQGRAHGPDRSEQPTRAVSRLLARVQWVFRRDTYVFLCTLFGVAGQLRFMVWLFAVGTTASWMSILLYRALVPLLAGQGSEGA